MKNTDKYMVSVNCIDCNLEIVKNKFLLKHWGGRCKKCAHKKLLKKYERGQKVGECVFVKVVDSIDKNRRGEFICNCGNHFECRISHVQSGSIISCKNCGFKRSVFGNIKHGLDGVPEYHIWVSMRDRCYNKNHKNYERYGGRGILMSSDWLNSVQTFISDMGERPSKLHTVDRIDNSQGYSKENCRWATKREQANNTRRNIFIEKDGQKLSVSEWSRRTNLSQKVLHSRLRNRLPLEYLFIPIQPISVQKEINKKFKTQFCI